MFYRSPQFWLLFTLILVSVLAIGQQVADTRKLRKPVFDNPITDSGTKLPQDVTIFGADPVRGDKSADITIIEFSDFACPYCAEVASLLKTAVANNKGKIKLVWKDFPLPTHAESLPAAEAAQCAGAQGKFWEYHDKLFSAQNNLGEVQYNNLAIELGLDTIEFKTCLIEHKSRALIQKNFIEGQAVGLAGTPFLIVGKKTHTGVITVEELEQLVSKSHASSADK